MCPDVSEYRVLDDGGSGQPVEARHYQTLSAPSSISARAGLVQDAQRPALCRRFPRPEFGLQVDIRVLEPTGDRLLLDFEPEALLGLAIGAHA
jgi:hypothetical protein